MNYKTCRISTYSNTLGLSKRDTKISKYLKLLHVVLAKVKRIN